MNSINYLIIKMLVKVKYANIINIAANEEIIPELLQSNCNSKNTNSSSTQEEKSPEFDLMLEKNGKDLISSDNNITENKISENEIILNQTLDNGINFIY